MTKEPEGNMCRIPVQARYQIDDNGNPVLISAEWRDIPADAIARYLAQHFGLEKIKSGVLE